MGAQREHGGDDEVQSFAGAPVRVHVDARGVPGRQEGLGGIKKGVPIRLEVGPKDIEQDAVFLGRRDKKPRDKQSVARGDAPALSDGVVPARR